MNVSHNSALMTRLLWLSPKRQNIAERRTRGLCRPADRSLRFVWEKFSPFRRSAQTMKVVPPNFSGTSLAPRKGRRFGVVIFRELDGNRYSWPIPNDSARAHPLIFASARVSALVYNYCEFDYVDRNKDSDEIACVDQADEESWHVSKPEPSVSFPVYQRYTDWAFAASPYRTRKRFWPVAFVRSQHSGGAGKTGDREFSLQSDQKITARYANKEQDIEGMTEWAAWHQQLRETTGRSSPVTDDRNVRGILRRGWFRPTLVPLGYDEATGERLQSKDEDAA